jgi:multidrug efflux pump
VQQQFFPLSERPELFFQIRLPEGSCIGATLSTVRNAENLIDGDKDVASSTSYVGQGSPRFWLGLSPRLPNENFAEIVIVARNVAARERLKARLDASVAAGALPEAWIRVDRFNFGPPVGFPVQFRVVGPDPSQVRSIAYQVRDIVRADHAVIDPNLDWNEQLPSLHLVVDQERARALGLTPQDIANSLQTLISGVVVTTIRQGIEKIDVVARAVKGERLDPGRMGDLTISTRTGAPLPLSQVARIEYGHEEAILWRRNRDMAITVRADVVDGVQAPDVTNRIWLQLLNLRAQLPQGYRLEIGGAVEESETANASLAAVFPVMIVAMLTLLMFQLQNFARLFLVLMSAPLGLIGASLALNLTGSPFSFVALLGLISLSGMDMRNSLILLDQVRQDLELGANYRDAIVEATVRRAHPVALTASAAILAMIPLSRSAFWGPMAITMMGGLFVATFLTLLFLPALYAIWFRRSLGMTTQAGEAAQTEGAPAAGPAQ